jgi:hypothetical protein
MKQRKTSTPKIRPFNSRQIITFLKQTQEGKYSKVAPKIEIKNRTVQPRPIALEDNYFYGVS